MTPPPASFALCSPVFVCDRAHCVWLVRPHALPPCALRAAPAWCQHAPYLHPLPGASMWATCTPCMVPACVLRAPPAWCQCVPYVQPLRGASVGPAGTPCVVPACALRAPPAWCQDGPCVHPMHGASVCRTCTLHVCVSASCPCVRRPVDQHAPPFCALLNTFEGKDGPTGRKKNFFLVVH